MDPVGPKLFPIVIGVVLLVLAVVLAVAIPRGSVGEADAGEDVDPDMPSDWRTVGLLVGVVRRHHPAGEAARLGHHRRPAVRRRGDDPGQPALRPQHRHRRGARRSAASTRSTPGSESRCPQAFWTGFSDMDNLRLADPGVRPGRHPDEPAVRRDRRAAGHRGRRAARYRARHDGGAAAARSPTTSAPVRRSSCSRASSTAACTAGPRRRFC